MNLRKKGGLSNPQKQGKQSKRVHCCATEVHNHAVGPVAVHSHVYACAFACGHPLIEAWPCATLLTMCH